MFPGDFESLFSESHLKFYIKTDDSAALNKEKFTYETKYQMETNHESSEELITEEGKAFLTETFTKIELYVEKVREIKNESILDNLGGSTIDEDIETSDNLPF